MLGAIALGAAQGVHHSFEPDHLAAVTVLVREQRSARRGAWLGAIWGLGHTVSLLAIGVALVGFGAVLPPQADRAFALAVAAVLVGLGLRALWPARAHEPPRRVRTPLQALLVGAIHGLAGSSALAAAVFASLPDAASRLAYIGLFGAGSVAGMAAVSGAAGLWLQRVDRAWVVTALRVTIGLASIGLGVAMAIDALAA